jgi:isopenicillin N synthase-like dioxygenase
MEDLALKLLEMFALALEEPPDFFLDKMDHHMSALRLVDYYPLPQQKTDMVRAGAHTDYGALTILNAQDPGLQVLLYDKNRTNTQWYSVPVVSGSLVINLGDLMQRWTNGM